MDKRIFNTQN